MGGRHDGSVGPPRRTGARSEAKCVDANSPDSSTPITSANRANAALPERKTPIDGAREGASERASMHRSAAYLMTCDARASAGRDRAAPLAHDPVEDHVLPLLRSLALLSGALSCAHPDHVALAHARGDVSSHGGSSTANAPGLGTKCRILSTKII